MKTKKELLEAADIVSQEEERKSLEKLAEQEELQTFLSYNAKGQPIVGAIKENREYYFNSRYEDEPLIRSWCNQADISNYRTVLLVFGIGNGEYLRALRKQNEEMFIIVFEPSYSIAMINRDTIGLEDILSDSNLLLFIGKDNMKVVQQILERLISYEVIWYAKLFITPNYENVFEEEFKEINEIYRTCISSQFFNRNTVLAFSNKVADNVAENLLDCLEQYSLYGLIKNFEQVDVTDIPAIIVAAGPSLDKNIQDLKPAKGKALIIAVDTALNALGKANIVPDIAVTVDPNKTLSLFQNEKMERVPLIYDLSCNAQIKSVHKGMRIYQQSEYSLLDVYLRKYQKRERLLTGGSVANDAFSLAQRLGFRTVIFAGLDLAYPEDKMHSEATYEDAAVNDVKNSGRELFDVEDIYGNQVKTAYDMNHYRMWFEQTMKLFPDIHVIDATEGGAKKKGMEIMTLKEAVTRECTIKHMVDFSEIIQKTEKMFTDEEQLVILKDLSEFSKSLDSVRRRLKEGLLLYEDLERLNNQKIYKGKQFKKTIQNITRLNTWVSENPDIAYLHRYAAEKDYQVKEGILDDRESTADEIQLVIDSGVTMLNALLEATNRVEADMEPVIREAKDKIVKIYDR